MSRAKRMFSDSDAAELLLKAQAWRLECRSVQAGAPIGSPVYRAVGDVMAAIDSVAEAITGNREHFWTKQASIGDGPNHREPSRGED